VTSTSPIFEDPPRSPVLALLVTNGLPTADIGAGSPARFFAAGTPEHIRGVVAIEVHGEYGLLRSLAVDADHRGEGIGYRLLLHAEARAGAMGVNTLYLLTETAATFFTRSGYAPAERERVPAAIAATREFAELCPGSAACLVKRL
jgi:amino-acid N-acetyltransferase